MFSTAIFLSFLPPGGEYPRSSGYRYKLAETPIQSPVYFYVSTSNAFYQAIVDTLAITRKQFCSTRVFSLSLFLSLSGPRSELIFVALKTLYPSYVTLHRPIPLHVASHNRITYYALSLAAIFTNSRAARSSDDRAQRSNASKRALAGNNRSPVHILCTLRAQQTVRIPLGLNTCTRSLSPRLVSSSRLVVLIDEQVLQRREHETFLAPPTHFFASCTRYRFPV